MGSLDHCFIGSLKNTYVVSMIQWPDDPMTQWIDGRYYCSFAYSALASCKMGTLGSAFFQRPRKSW